MLTTVKEVESIINERSLVPHYDHPQGPSVLRPSDILILGDDDNALIASDVNVGECYKRSWRQAQLLSTTFCKRWIEDHLPMEKMFNAMLERINWFQCLTEVHLDLCGEKVR